MYELLTPIDRATARPWRRTAAPLGAALLITDLVAFDEGSNLAEVADANRHAPLACTRPRDPVGRGILQALKVHPSLRRIVVVDVGRNGCIREALRLALTAGGPPTADEVAAYILSIQGGPTFARALRAELASAPTPSRSSRHAAFQRTGALTGLGWTSLFALARALSVPGLPRAEQAAGAIGVDVRTLRSYCDKLLLLEWQDVKYGFGWRWAVDRALQVHGYVAREVHVPLAIDERSPRARLGMGI